MMSQMKSELCSKCSIHCTSMDVISRLMHFIAKKKQQNRLFKEMATIQSLSNEIGTVQQVLNTLHIDGCDITLDALHCQKETAKQVIQGNGDYTIIVKSNQKNSIKTFARHLHISKRHMIHRSMCMKRSKKTMVELNGVV